MNGCQSHRFSTFLLLTAATLVCSCGYMRLVGEKFTDSVGSIGLQSPLAVRETETKIDGVLTGNVRGAGTGGSPVAIAAFATSYSTADNQRSDRLTTCLMLPQPGHYVLYVPAGRYKIFVFTDTNRNFVLEPTEFAGQLTRPGTVAIRPNQIITGLDIELWEPGTRQFDFSLSLKDVELRHMPRNVLETGGTIRLDNAIFKRKYGAMGLWQPADFVKKIGIHLYALEPFDAGRIPVVFIHGINGTPFDWKYLAKGLDTRRFQPWFYYYPSGLRLNLVSGLLHEKIRVTRRRYGFEKLVVVAHSMGGLVTRGYINRQAASNDAFCPEMFVSISTPWGGDKTARVGLNSSPLTVPSWQDVAEGSRFIEALYRQKLPPDLRFYLFFSYGGNRRFHWDTNDGTVTLQSQLDPRAKSEARRTEGFYEDHITVLASSDVERKLNELLSAGLHSPSEAAIQDPLKTQMTAADAGEHRLPADPARAPSEQMPAEVRRYVELLQSLESADKIEAARRIYRKQIKHPAIFRTAARELKKGYRVNLADSAHIDAMAWMCNLLGMSGKVQYREILSEVVQETPNSKIRRYASKSMGRLPQRSTAAGRP